MWKHGEYEDIEDIISRHFIPGQWDAANANGSWEPGTIRQQAELNIRDCRTVAYAAYLFGIRKALHNIKAELACADCRGTAHRDFPESCIRCEFCHGTGINEHYDAGSFQDLLDSIKHALTNMDTKEAGSKGGKARAAKMTKEQRSESARKAAKARWAKNNVLPKPNITSDK